VEESERVEEADTENVAGGVAVCGVLTEAKAVMVEDVVLVVVEIVEDRTEGALEELALEEAVEEADAEEVGVEDKVDAMPLMVIKRMRLLNVSATTTTPLGS
jgi:hypothetical protein